MKIIREGNKKTSGHAICKNCNCWYEYSKNDLKHRTKSNSESVINIEYVRCPCCGSVKYVSKTYSEK